MLFKSQLNYILEIKIHNSKILLFLQLIIGSLTQLVQSVTLTG